MSKWLRMLCAHSKLASLAFRTSVKHGQLLQDSSMLVISEDVYSVFLFPQDVMPTTALTMNEIQARGWGWVYVRPGQIIRRDKQSILLLSDIHGEDFDVEPIHPAKYVHWLRRKIKNETYVGVKIKSEEGPGERIVRDIRYSEQARELYRSGVVWKQFVDGKAIFTPIDSEDDTKL